MKTYFFKLQRKIKFSTCFSIFSGPIFFCWWVGPGISLQDPPRPSKLGFSRKTRVEAPNAVTVRKLRNTNAVLMSQKNSRKIAGGSELWPKQFFLSVGSLTDKTSLQPTKWPQRPPKTAISQAPRTHGTPNRVQWARI